MTENNPLQAAASFLGNLKDQAEDLVENLAEQAEAAADKVIGEENVDKFKEVMTTDVGSLAHEAAAVVQDKAEDLMEGAGKIAADLKEKAQDLTKGKDE